MESEYVYKNVYEVDQRRIEEKFEKAVEHNDMRTDYFMARVDSALSEMRGDLKAMNAKLSGLTWSVNLLLAVTGIAVAGVSIYLALIK